MMRPVTALAAALSMMLLPVAAVADKPAHAGGNAKKAQKIERKVERRTGKRAQERAQTGRAPVAIMAPGRAMANVCPPGLAKKSPACVPPGQAKKDMVGSVVRWNDVHIVTRPGLYGLGDPPSGQRYAVVDGRLVRVDRDTGRILSILRLVDAILD